MRTSLSGVWKISASLRGKQSTVLPKRIRFEDTSENPPPPRQLPAMAVLECGSCSVPYAEHCGGQYELWTPSNAEDPDELRAGFVIECAEKDDAPPSRLSFDGLYDGERIAGTVHDDKAGGEVIADFLCTRLFSFWGTPSPRAGKDTPG